MNKFFAASSIVTVLILVTGWASAADSYEPAGMTCKVVQTTIRVDSKGQTIITVKKVCTK